MSARNFINGTVWTGDNLPILRGMSSDCVDLIYLDPPFNSNRNYAAPIGSKAAGAAFKDAWTLSDVDVHEHGEQEGICAGCHTHFPFKIMEVDHILPRAKGGTDHIENLQLLCSHCNRSKGGKTMAQWRAAQGSV